MSAITIQSQSVSLDDQRVRPRSGPRNLLLKLHIYGGLLCFSYLMVLGITVLNFNHPSVFARGKGASTTWTQPVHLPQLIHSISGNGKNAQASKTANNQHIRDALGLLASSRTGPESFWKNAHTYHALLWRTGKNYDVDVHTDQGLAVVTTTRWDLWAVLRSLHGRPANMPGSLLAHSWAWYTEFCTFILLFQAGSGVWFWKRRQSERTIGLILLGVGLSLFLLVFSLAFYR